MITYIRNLFAKEREAKAKRAWLRGFDWAAGLLLRNTSPADIRANLDGWEPLDFDRGAEAACVRFEGYMSLKDKP